MGGLVRFLFPCIKVKGIRAVYTDTRTLAQFSLLLERSLNVLETADPLRYKRVQRHIKFIVQIWNSSGALYLKSSKTCLIDFSMLSNENQLEAAKELAAVLVYEATYGYIDSKKVWLNSRNAGRISIICFKEVDKLCSRIGLQLPQPTDGEMRPLGLWQSLKVTHNYMRSRRRE
jgi:hypothetical protein